MYLTFSKIFTKYVPHAWNVMYIANCHNDRITIMSITHLHSFSLQKRQQEHCNTNYYPQYIRNKEENVPGGGGGFR